MKLSDLVGIFFLGFTCLVLGYIIGRLDAKQCQPSAISSTEMPNGELFCVYTTHPYGHATTRKKHERG